MALSRRRFLENSFATTAAAMAAGRVTHLVAAEETQSKSPNERLSVACIGVRGQGNSHLGAYSGRQDTEVTYVCDADEQVGQQRAKAIGERQGRTPKFVKDMREVFDDPSVDVISTATPNHWHALVSVWAIQAGKDVYVEKPVSHNVWEGRQIVNAARKHNRIVQCGTQIRSSSSVQEAVKFVQEGNLGKIQYAIGTCYKPRGPIGKRDKPLEIPAHIDYDLWCGPAAKQPIFRNQLHYDWHWDFNTGNGDLGNQGIHQMDIARWFLGEEALSPRVMSIGGRLGYEDAGNTPNTQIIYHDYEQAPLIFEVRGLKTGDYRGSRVGVVIQCEEGYVVVPSYTSVTAFDNDGQKIQTWNGGGDHHGNFISAVRSRKPSDLNAEILDGHLSSALCHTGNISHRLGSKTSNEEITALLKSDPVGADAFQRMAKHLEDNGVDIDSHQVTLGPWLEMDPQTERFVNNSGANELLTRRYREPFVVPEIS